MVLDLRLRHSHTYWLNILKAELERGVNMDPVSHIMLGGH